MCVFFWEVKREISLLSRCHDIPENTSCWPNVVFMLGRRRRRRANNKTTLGQRLVFAGMRIVQIELFSHYSIGFTSYLLTVVNDFR